MVRELINHLDLRLPGSLQGLYLIGSIALGDFCPGQSDVDFLAVLRPNADVDRLTLIHAELSREYPGIHCDGIYLEKPQLARRPDCVGPTAHEGRVVGESRDERQPVTWLTFLRHGITIRGDAPDSTWVEASVEAASDYSRQNLQSYWRPWIEQRRVTDLSDWEVAWGGLGIARLHALITQGLLLSKSAAGQYIASAMPQHASIAREALRIRSNAGPTGYLSLSSRRDDLVAMMNEIIETCS